MSQEELPDGFYYTQTGKDRIIAIDMYDKESNTWLLNSDKDMPPFEVLAPVPTWEEYKKLEYANDMFISQVANTSLDKKLVEQEQEIAVRKDLNDKVKLLKAALRYSNSTVKWVLPLIETAYDARIVKVVEEMLNKTNEVLR